MIEKWMMVLVLGTATTIACAAGSADPKRGQVLVQKKCVSCHVSMYGGDGSEIYLRPDHKVKTPAQLTSQIAACNANTGAGWFPDDEADVAAYLNQKYYKFK